MSRNSETKNQYQDLFDVRDNKNVSEINRFKNLDDGHYDFRHFYKYFKFLYYFYLDYKDVLEITVNPTDDNGEVNINQNGNFIEKLWRLIKTYKVIKVTDTVKYYSNQYFALLCGEKYGEISEKLFELGIFPINVENKKHKLSLDNGFHNKIYLIKKEDSGKQIKDYCNPENGISFGFIQKGEPIEDIKILDKIKTDDIRGVKIRLSCPLKCDNITRQWLCAECGQFVELLTMGIMITYCKCGYMKYDVKNMVCNRFKHEKQLEEDVSLNFPF